MNGNYPLFPGLRETPQTPEKHALLQRAAKSKRKEKAGWRNLEPEIQPAGRVGPYRFWLAPATVEGIPMMVLELYCANDDCNYGPINIVERRLGRRYPEPGQPQKCPGCGEPAKLQWRVTGDEYREQCRVLFDIAATADEERLPVDPAHVFLEMRDRLQLEGAADRAAGDPEELRRLVESEDGEGARQAQPGDDEK